MWFCAISNVKDKVIAHEPTRVLQLQEVHANRWQFIQSNGNRLTLLQRHSARYTPAVNDQMGIFTDMPRANPHAALTGM